MCHLYIFAYLSIKVSIDLFLYLGIPSWLLLQTFALTTVRPGFLLLMGIESVALSAIASEPLRQPRRHLLCFCPLYTLKFLIRDASKTVSPRRPNRIFVDICMFGTWVRPTLAELCRTDSYTIRGKCQPMFTDRHELNGPLSIR